jgi:NitT/TauT family transport system substrate-binding protein
LEAEVKRAGLVPLLVVLFATACGGAASTPHPGLVTDLTVGLGYIPSVQFAQFYRAKRHGYYADAGLAVTFQNQDDPNLITLLGQGAIDVGIADGTSIIPAVAQDIPVVYGATIYAQFPSVVLVGADSGITDAAGLAGRSLGIPCRCGSSWTMLEALLSSAGLTPDELNIQLYPTYGQAVALQQGQVDAATGFLNNEPIQLQQQGFATNVLSVDAIVPLPGPGLVVGRDTLATKGTAIRAFVAATMRAMREIIADPQAGLDDAIAQVPDLANDRATQLAVLQATIGMWQSAYTGQHGLGAIDSDGWQKSLDFMRGLAEQSIPASMTVDQLVTQELLP